MDIEEFINFIELEFKIDFTSLPQWRELIEIMNIAQTDYKIRKRNAENRKYEIIQKIYMQNSRLTPFELTDKLIRTSRKWQDMKLKHKSIEPKVSNIKDDLLIMSCDDHISNVSEPGDQTTLVKCPSHPNTEEAQIEAIQDTELELNWHISPKIGYPKAIVHIKNTDDACYCLHIRKRYVNFVSESDESDKSNEVNSLDSKNFYEREEGKELELQNTILSTPNTRKSSAHFDKFSDDLQKFDTIDIVALVVSDIIDLALEPFIFKHTYLCIEPRSKKFVKVYFTKVHHIGYHQSYYDFIFIDSKDSDMTLTKTTKVFAEVLPHPVSIKPKILDMTRSPVTFGYLKDSFTITNSHKIFPVTIKITSTLKMKKIFKITPKEMIVCPLSSTIFYVTICTKRKNELITGELAYFTIKISIKGHESIYKNVPPFFYEIITPCCMEFREVYDTEYCSDASDLSRCKNLEDTKNSYFL
ncbi:uncharacterized protein LOC112045167 [Bicyclus anynana]|uniref:Uncharacterized protein LOC112045167 n=1 Tax=Bicyclus anynana TaxID=110368 RepID=A0ABM3LY01_BICAN|nr:uncharacterized protein LOC112045167 [Bicyclus anynana]